MRPLSSDCPTSRVLGVRLPTDESERLIRHAEQQAQTISAAVRSAVRFYLDEIERAERLHKVAS